MRKIIVTTALILSFNIAKAAGPGLGNLLNGIDDSGSGSNNADGSAGGAGIPVDGGLTFFIGGSILYGAKKIREQRKK
jgi:hypothetical protein